MNQQEPLEKEEFQTAQDSTKPVETLSHDHAMHHKEGLIEPIVKEYVPLEVGIVIFTIAILVLFIIEISTNMWGLVD